MAEQNQLATTDPMTEFQNRVRVKLREDIGQMLPDEAINPLVARAVEDTFFKRERVRDTTKHYSGYGDIPMTDAPSWFMSEVARQAEPMIKQAVSDHIEKNLDAIDAAIADHLTRERLSIVAATLAGEATRNGIADGIRGVIEELQNRGIIRY